MKKLSVFCLLIFAMCSISHAEGEKINEQTDSISILSVENWVASNALYIHTSDNTAKNPAGCAITDRYILPESASSFSRSMIMAAYTAGQKLSFTIYHGSCVNNRPHIVSAKFERDGQ